MNKKIALGIMGVAVFGFSITISLGWFYQGKKIDTDFDSSIIGNYFDASSYSDTTLATGEYYGDSTHPLIITKPIHLYNLSRLQNLGKFSTSDYYFQFGKLKSSIDSTSTDTTYYTYTSNLADESLLTGLSSTTIDMSSYTDGVYSIGTKTYPFTGTLKGNSVVVSDIRVIPDLTDNNNIYTLDSVSYVDVGFFGRIKTGANITNFNIKNITVDLSDYNTSDYAFNAGLILGFAEEAASNDVTLSSIGVANGIIMNNSATNANASKSQYSLIGGITAGFESDLTTNFGGHDTGVMLYIKMGFQPNILITIQIHTVGGTY